MFCWMRMPSTTLCCIAICLIDQTDNTPKPAYETYRVKVSVSTIQHIFGMCDMRSPHKTSDSQFAPIILDVHEHSIKPKHYHKLPSNRLSGVSGFPCKGKVVLCICIGYTLWSLYLWLCCIAICCTRIFEYKSLVKWFHARRVCVCTLHINYTVLLRTRMQCISADLTRTMSAVRPYGKPRCLAFAKYYAGVLNAYE